MDEMMLAGLFAVVIALPGLLLGGALLAGLWQPASLQDANDPDRLRRTVGSMVLGAAGAVVALGLGLVLLPRAMVDAALPYGLGVVALVAVVMAVRVMRKRRAG
ncbi:hypothetical protein [Arenimonas alkanexedens]